MDLRYADFPCVDGRSLYGLLVTLGTDVLLGRTGNHFAVWCNSGYW
ncbi:Uncharacterised protein [Vibrio cholerae]|nr:Uncharacterised protein [Vibrio cholerae]